MSSYTASFCRSCGKALTEDEKQVPGNLYCTACAPAAPPPPPVAALPPPPVADGPSAGLAFLLGLIPGVGAIYNGQYAKGLMHVVVLGMLFGIADADVGEFKPLAVMLALAWFPYMAFEAYHTALRRQRGEPVDEFSSLIPSSGAGFPVAPVVLIAAGVVFLLNNLGLLRLAVVFRFWPVLLIALGVYLLVDRARAVPDQPRDNMTMPPPDGEVRHESN